MEDFYKKKLQSYTDTIQIERENLAKVESKLISFGQKIINKVHQLESFNTPTKKPKSNSILHTTASSTNKKNSNQSSINNKNSQLSRSHMAKLEFLSSLNNRNSPKQKKTPEQIAHINQINQNIAQLSQIMKNYQQQFEKQRELLQRTQQSQRQKQDQIQRLQFIIKEKEQRQIELEKEYQTIKQRALQKAKQLQKQRVEQQKQLEMFLSTSHKLKDLLDEKSKYIQIEYEKSKVWWNEERKRNLAAIDNLQRKLQQKDEKLQQMLQNITRLKHEHKITLQKCEELSKVVSDQSRQIKDYKQQNIQIKLENKNLKADNKVVLAHLDKLLNEKLKNSEKNAREVFEQREQRVINTLYSQTLAPKSPKRQDLLPSQRNELSNKVKLQKIKEQYEIHRKQANKMILKLEERIKYLEQDNESKRKQIQILQINLKKTNEIRDMEKQTFNKKQSLIFDYERQIAELSKHNQCLSNELQKCYRYPKFKQRIGCIVSSPTNAKKAPILQDCDDDFDL